jgi:hypothetical protein
MNEMGIMNKAIDKLPTLADPVPEFVAKRTLKPLLFGSYGLILLETIRLIRYLDRSGFSE